MNFNDIKNMNNLDKLITKTRLEKNSYILSMLLIFTPLLIFFLNLILPSATNSIWLTLILLLGLLTNLNAFLYVYKLYKEHGKNFIISHLKSNKYIIFLFLYIIWCFISCFFSSNKFKSFFGTDYLCESFLCFLAYFGIFSNVIFIKNKDLLKKILTLFVISVSLISIVTLLSYYFNLNFHFFRRFTSIFMNENHYAYYINIGLIANTCLILFYDNKKLNIIYTVLYLINCHMLILNDTLGCFLAFICTLFLIFVYLLITKRNLSKFIILVISLIIICFVNRNIVLNNFSSFFGDIISIEKNISKKDDIKKIYNTGSNRMGLWLVTIQLIKEKPVFGYGIGNLLEQYIRVNKSEITSRPHNEYLQVGVSIGIPGLIFYLLFLGLLFFKVIVNIKKISNFEVSILFIIVTYLVSSFFGVSIFYTTPYLYLFLGLLSGFVIKNKY